MRATDEVLKRKNQFMTTFFSFVLQFQKYKHTQEILANIKIYDNGIMTILSTSHMVQTSFYTKQQYSLMTITLQNEK